MCTIYIELIRYVRYIRYKVIHNDWSSLYKFSDDSEINFKFLCLSLSFISSDGLFCANHPRHSRQVGILAGGSLKLSGEVFNKNHALLS